ncbi:MAG: hypothetical protein M1835_007149 [Candelina submexicana]|nr:MAG: hypothetical protein M1835_007149 [Candelina submexicana]
MVRPTVSIKTSFSIAAISILATSCDGFSLFGRSSVYQAKVPRNIIPNQHFPGQLEGRSLPAPNASDIVYTICDTYPSDYNACSSYITNSLYDSEEQYCAVQDNEYTQCLQANSEDTTICADEKFGYQTCANYTVNIYADCINAGFVNPQDVPSCASNRLNIQLNNNPDPFSTVSNNLAPFQLPNVVTFSPSGRPGSSPNSSLEFTFTDPNNGQESTTCSVSWPAAKSPYIGDLPCADAKFTFRLTQFSSVRTFTLALSHTTSGTTYSGVVAIDAQGTNPNFTCTYGASSVESCAISTGKSPILVPITGVTGASFTTSAPTPPYIAPRHDVSSLNPGRCGIEFNGVTCDPAGAYGADAAAGTLTGLPVTLMVHMEAVALSMDIVVQVKIIACQRRDAKAAARNPLLLPPQMTWVPSPLPMSIAGLLTVQKLLQLLMNTAGQPLNLPRHLAMMDVVE